MLKVEQFVSFSQRRTRYAMNIGDSSDTDQFYAYRE